MRSRGSTLIISAKTKSLCPETLEKLDKLDERPILVAVAAYVGKTRLIDNTMLNKAKKDAGRRESVKRCACVIFPTSK